MMTADELLAAVHNGAPPRDLAPLLRALCFEAGGDWETAHQIAQSDGSRDAAWIHAYLHRREGDLANAAYWYRRAGRPVERGGLEEEWRTIAATLLNRPLEAGKNP
jgi:hypothetical protein